jgi:hypothetical protein
MMSLSAIKDMSREAAIKAAKEKKVPLILEQEDLDYLRDYGRFTKKTMAGGGIPFIGDHVPKGWKRTDILTDDWDQRSKYEHDGMGSYFVDTSGFGSEGEGALTIKGMGRVFRPGFGYALIEVGQFQGNIGVFEKS